MLPVPGSSTTVEPAQVECKMVCSTPCLRLCPYLASNCVLSWHLNIIYKILAKNATNLGQTFRKLVGFLIRGHCWLGSSSTTVELTQVGTVESKQNFPSIHRNSHLFFSNLFSNLVPNIPDQTDPCSSRLVPDLYYKADSTFAPRYKRRLMTFVSVVGKYPTVQKLCRNPFFFNFLAEKSEFGRVQTSVFFSLHLMLLFKKKKEKKTGFYVTHF